MSSRFEQIWIKDRRFNELADVNQNSISEYNEKMLSSITLIGGILILLPILATPFSHTKLDIIPVYLMLSGLSFAMFFLFKLQFFKKYVLLGLYFYFSGFFLFAIYLSVIHTPHMRATILLGAFCIIPLGFIDRPSRMNLFVFFWFVIHTILAFYLKPLYALDDTINALCFTILGCFIGNIMVVVRLDSYEAQRLLIIEKETDVLTGLYNRRKLFETLAILEQKESEKPTGIMMIDIDHFKEFNDKFGHASGDKYLNNIGDVLRKFKESFHLNFYRYGGEEFVAIAYGYSKKDLLSIAESIRIGIHDMEFDGHHTSVSIGVAYCGDEQIRNYENVIDRADKAVYIAKNEGKNKVCIEQGKEVF